MPKENFTNQKEEEFFMFFFTSINLIEFLGKSTLGASKLWSQYLNIFFLLHAWKGFCEAIKATCWLYTMLIIFHWSFSFFYPINRKLLRNTPNLSKKSHIFFHWAFHCLFKHTQFFISILALSIFYSFFTRKMFFYSYLLLLKTPGVHNCCNSIFLFVLKLITHSLDHLQ